MKPDALPIFQLLVIFIFLSLDCVNNFLRVATYGDGKCVAASAIVPPHNPNSLSLASKLGILRKYDVGNKKRFL